MTDIQIRECFGIKSSAPDRVLRNDEEILQSIKNNIGFTEIFGDVRVNEVLQEIRQEIADRAQWHYSHNQEDVATIISCEALEIIDKHIKEIEE